jgi:hypothetical protein
VEGKEYISVIHKIKSGVYIRVSKNAKINNYILKEKKIYKLTYDILDRESNDSIEYFMQKELVSFIPSYEDELKEMFIKLIYD